jgi:hypothetical protein
MVEIFSIDRTISLGCFENFKAAKGTLNGLIVSGKLGENLSVFVCSYNGDKLQREYTATYNGKWHVPTSPKRQVQAKDIEKTTRKKHWCKIYKSPEQCFKEGFPDWMNKVYQPV